MDVGDKVYIVSNQKNDTGIHGALYNSVDYYCLLLYSIILDNDQIIRVPEWNVRKKEKTYSIGTKVRIQPGLLREDHYVISKTGHCMEVNLINPNSGNVWDQPIKVKSCSKITETEINKLVSGYDWEVVE